MNGRDREAAGIAIIQQGLPAADHRPAPRLRSRRRTLRSGRALTPPNEQ